MLRHGELHGLSRARVQRLVADGRVLVNGARARRPAQRVRLGDVVALDVAPPRPRPAPTPESLPVHVVYEDDDLLVVNKPPGQVVHPSFKNTSGTLVNALLGRARDDGVSWTPHLVQRLDKGTSGLLLVAKSRAVQTALQAGRRHQGVSGPGVGAAAARRPAGSRRGSDATPSTAAG